MTTIGVIVCVLIFLAAYNIGKVKTQRKVFFILKNAQELKSTWEELFVRLIKDGYTQQLDLLMATYFRIRGEWKT
jgi:excinuclease UvrABC helicase subunit UvrB